MNGNEDSKDVYLNVALHPFSTKTAPGYVKKLEPAVHAEFDSCVWTTRLVGTPGMEQSAGLKLILEQVTVPDSSFLESAAMLNASDDLLFVDGTDAAVARLTTKAAAKETKRKY